MLCLDEKTSPEDMVAILTNTVVVTWLLAFHDSTPF